MSARLNLVLLLSAFCAFLLPQPVPAFIKIDPVCTGTWPVLSTKNGKCGLEFTNSIISYDKYEWPIVNKKTKSNDRLTFTDACKKHDDAYDVIKKHHTNRCYEEFKKVNREFWCDLRAQCKELKKKCQRQLCRRDIRDDWYRKVVDFVPVLAAKYGCSDSEVYWKKPGIPDSDDC
uniref:Phospholipase A2 n=1 Tax=Chromera velia CCMP2878 TaxID=1169474 RepID=A0A0G4HE18_9ALVE|mmetsp:Transcript_7631/g.14873  ORF Transcript_7631/g.14873 Transcript_7631/m.14873 type:complete len:175 (-) Transcript_7631:44-568(-)|eukprot:Cvel_26621.t1-p1 / transcript=Cvel_26621.t1 / gene=Cvel_26621 / organism=Chromera_velia_CCMP2878 / gene_product=hypothetical protein / transcript_product=hypothetical protein / location=Cvel_scaffold3196:15441-16845(+) / protein_length=174 / sequence_SO=supercontig / SO=protein_coding / is_pseudo=false